MKNLPSIFKHRDNFIGSFDRVFDQMLQKQFPSLTEEIGLDFLTKSAYPRVDIIDYKNKIEINSEIPGLTKKDITIEIKDGVLSITGKKSDRIDKTDKGTYLYRELKHSSFRRSFTLGDNIKTEDIKAKFENGILNIALEKTKAILEEVKVIDID